MGTIFIPDKIAVGFQERGDTYTKMLAYVVYYDAKGKRRKEASWESWCSKKIEKKDFDNVPTSGFVLNKKVGGYKSDWNFRQAYVRVYDPRNFEFEITVPNLLFILENTNSIKGKGLEGEFVYAWDGSDLLLLPVDSPDYQKIKGYSAMVKAPEKILSKNLILGGTYMTKTNEEWIYLGRYEKYGYNYDYTLHKQANGAPLGPHYFFAVGKGFEAIRSISGKFIKVVSDQPVANYAELMDELQHQKIYAPLVDKFEYIPVTIPEFNNDRRYPGWGSDRNKGSLGLYVRYNGEMIGDLYISIANRLDENSVAVASGYYISTNGWRRSEDALDRMMKERHELFDWRNGVDLATLNELEFFEKYQYLANNKIYHG